MPAAEYSKVYCIKTCEWSPKRIFIKGNFYNTKRYTSDSHRDTILINYDNNYDFIAGSIGIFMLGKKPDYSSKEYKEFFERYGSIGTAGPVYPYFEDHFIDIKTLRKQKLKQLLNHE